MQKGVSGTSRTYSYLSITGIEVRSDPFWDGAGRMSHHLVLFLSRAREGQSVKEKLAIPESTPRVVMSVEGHCGRMGK